MLPPLVVPEQGGQPMGVGWISIILLGRLAVFAIAALCLGNHEATKLKKLLTKKLKVQEERHD